LRIQGNDGILMTQMADSALMCTIRKKGTKAVLEALPFQKEHFCTQRLHFGTLLVHINT